MITPEDVLAFEKTFTDKKTYRRFLCIKLKIIDGKTQAQIAQHTGFGFRHVQRIQAQVQHYGLHILYPKKGILRNSLLPSKQAEISLLNQHKGKVGIYDLQQALNELVGRRVGFQSVYRLLNRNGWKAKVPRPIHPNHNQEAQALFKKNAGTGFFCYKNSRKKEGSGLFSG